ncbi:MAG TPA: plastocyanin/azurin family copper-binding protein [Solirubrobacteraceae bacterium]|nr:plastocyanin/azurin family copper-binding protein [Solirubrobacteraceae bacterium]
MPRDARRSGLALILGSLVIALAGCGVKHPVADVVHGKVLFVRGCASCHTLYHAGSSGVTGPNLDDAFSQDRADGIKSASIQGLVDYWIQYPNTQGVMPAKIYSGQDAEDVAAYVGLVAGRPGQDTGALATAVPTVSQKPVTEKAGKLQIDADPTGQLKYLASSATATPGQVTIDMLNKSSTPHDIAISGNGVSQVGKIVANGGTSTVSVNLKPGKYTFFCTVPGHRAAGMVGTITVK